MSDNFDTHDEGRKPYPWTVDFETTRERKDHFNRPFDELAKVYASLGAYRRRQAAIVESWGVDGVLENYELRVAAHDAALLLRAALKRAEAAERISREAGRIR